DADRTVTHSLRKASDAPISGLVDGATYFVVESTTTGLATTVKLAASKGGSALAISGAGLTGSHTIGIEGVDLKATGEGDQTLTIDITSAGSGTQTLQGVGGARALAGAPSDIGLATASSANSGGGVVSVGDASASATLGSTATVTVGSSASLSATNSVALTSSTQQNVQALTETNSAGLAGLADATSHIVVTY